MSMPKLPYVRRNVKYKAMFGKYQDWIMNQTAHGGRRHSPWPELLTASGQSMQYFPHWYHKLTVFVRGWIAALFFILVSYSPAFILAAPQSSCMAIAQHHGSRCWREAAASRPDKPQGAHCSQTSGTKADRDAAPALPPAQQGLGAKHRVPGSHSPHLRGPPLRPWGCTRCLWKGLAAGRRPSRRLCRPSSMLCCQKGLLRCSWHYLR